MGEKKISKAKRERCPAGSHWNEEKKRCVATRKKKEERDEKDDSDEGEDED